MARKRLDLVYEDVKVEDVAAEGKAIAHIDGIVVFVESAIPGDVVDLRITKKKSNYMEGFVLKMKKPSEYRQEPFCSHFGLCGGCKWQALPYEMQLKAKQQQVYDQLVRIGHLEVPEIAPIIASDKTINYRNKLEYTFSSKRWLMQDENPDNLSDAQRCGLGFHVGRFFDKVVDVKKCYLQKDPSNDIRNFIREYCIENDYSFYDIRLNRGYMRSVFIRTTDDGQVMVILCFSCEDIERRTALLDALMDRFPELTSLYYVINTKLNDSISDLDCILYKGADAITETMENLRFKIGPKSFYQTNAGQAYKLYCVAREFASLTGNEIVYDLYTGTGTIAQFVSGKAAGVIGIEYVPEAIEDAKINALNNNIDNCQFYAGDMKDILTSAFVRKHGKPDVIILDPPRAGIHPDVAKVILEAEPQRIVYVSCNPASQARDLEILCQKYMITAVQPVDMFPHTHHVENVCKLVLK